MIKPDTKRRVEFRNVDYFHELLEILPFSLRSYILDYYNFCLRKIHLLSESTVLIFKQFRFFAVTDPKYDDLEEHKLTPKQLVGYLYGYYSNDRTRRIFLVRKSIHLFFHLREKVSRPIILSNFVPKGTKRLSWEFMDQGDEYDEDSLNIADIDTSIRDLPFTVEKLSPCSNTKNNTDGFWKSLKKGSRIREIRRICIKKVDTLKLIHEKIGNQLRLIRLEFSFDNSIPGTITFSQCQRLHLTISKGFGNYDFFSKMFPEVSDLTIVFDDKPSGRGLQTTSCIHRSFFTSLSRMLHLRKLRLRSRYKKFNVLDIRTFLDKNTVLRSFGVDSFFVNSEIVEEFENDCLESFSIFGIEKKEESLISSILGGGGFTRNPLHGSDLFKFSIVTKSILEMFLKSFKRLRHFGILHLPDIPTFYYQSMVTKNVGTKEFRDIMKCQTGMFGGDPIFSMLTLMGLQNNNNNNDDNNKKKLLDDEAMGIFYSRNTSIFRNLNSLSICLPFRDIKEKFFVNEQSKWENLSKLELCCKNDTDLSYFVFSDKSKLKLEDFHTNAKLYPSHFSRFSKHSSLKYFSGVDIEVDCYYYMKLNARNSLRIFDSYTEYTYYRVSDETPPIVDPLKRYQFDNFETPSSIQNIQCLEEEDSFLKKSVEKWNLLPPYSTNIDWKKYFTYRTKLESEREKVYDFDEEEKNIDSSDSEDEFDYDDKVSEENMKKYYSKFFSDLDSFFEDNYGGCLNISKDEYENNFKKSIFLQIEPSYYGYSLSVTVFSRLCSGYSFQFEYSYWNKRVEYERLLFEMKFCNKKVNFKKNKEYNPVGFNSMSEKSDNNIQIFAKHVHEKHEICYYQFEEEIMLRKIEKGMFGRKVFQEKNALIMFFYLIGCTRLNVRFSDDSESGRREWVLGVGEREYNVSFDKLVQGLKDYEEYDYDEKNPGFLEELEAQKKWEREFGGGENSFFF